MAVHRNLQISIFSFQSGVGWKLGVSSPSWRTALLLLPAPDPSAMAARPASAIELSILFLIESERIPIFYHFSNCLM